VQDSTAATSLLAKARAIRIAAERTSIIQPTQASLVKRDMEFSTSDYVLLALVGVGAIYYLFKDSLFGSGDSSKYGKVNGNGSTYGAGSGKVGPAGADGAGTGTGSSSVAAAGRDLAKAMELAVSFFFHPLSLRLLSRRLSAELTIL
jgi:hypothetical protein